MKRLLVLMVLCVLMATTVVLAESNFPGQTKTASSSALTVTVQSVAQPAAALAKEEAAGAATAEKAVAAPVQQQKAAVATFEVPMIQDQWFPDGTTVYLAGDFAGWPRDVDYRKMPSAVIANGKMSFPLVRANGNPYTGVLTGIAIFKVVTDADELAELIAGHVQKVTKNEPYLFLNVDETSPYAIGQNTDKVKYAIDCGAILKATAP